MGDFAQAFTALTGHSPFPWQAALFERLRRGEVPAACDIPTGLGKTLVIAVWMLARAAGAALPRRLVYVVNRRTVVDQTTVEVEVLRARLERAGITEPLAISTLRGQMADNRAWSEDPSRPAVICGTVDMIGSRLVFSGYRVGFKGRPLHAGFLGQDALIVHDEAHLEPAFQALLESVVAEQARCGDPWPLRVMALTATSRGTGAVFGLGAADLADPVVAQRVTATKQLTLHEHGAGDLVDRVEARVRSYADRPCAVIVFLRTVDDVQRLITRLRKVGMKTQQLTGTMRGYERDRLVNDPIVRRFLPGADPAPTDTVVLVCTSAGEVGVNLSADHLVCDLSTFDAMVQRFGRVNRFGRRTDSEVHVVHPADDTLRDPKDPVAARRLATLALLRALPGQASPHALSALPIDARRAAFAPPPEILPATEILFDAWAMTTIRSALPGRPPVSAYLHGVAAWEPPTTQIAWRDDVDRITGALAERYPPRDLLDDYPLKPHEVLADRTDRVVDTLIAVAPRAASAPIWVVDEHGDIEVSTLAELVAGDRKRVVERLADQTLVLSPTWSRPIDGMLSADGWTDGAQRSDADIADRWLDDHGNAFRMRVLDEAPRPRDMRLIRTIALGDPDAVDGDGAPVPWRWYELPRGADDDGSRGAVGPVLLDVHSADVERHARQLVEPLCLPAGLRQAVVLAARHHDHGKRRRIWQRSVGNADPARLLAKSTRATDLTSYRHELGSMLDAERDLLHDLSIEDRELALHLIAAHHGRARPHFPADELFDPERPDVDFAAEGERVMQRFARLQAQFGRWGLAYLESLVRAADYAASAAPSQIERDDGERGAR